MRVRGESPKSLADMFSLNGKVAVVTGGTGTLGGAMAQGLATAGARVAVLGRHKEKGRAVVRDIESLGGEAVTVQADVLDRATLERTLSYLKDLWGGVDILVNAAGGNIPGAVVDSEAHLFDRPAEAFGRVFDLNVMGTLLPIQVFGDAMSERGTGSIVNISSMGALRPLTKAIGYSAAKSAVDNLTRWLAVEFARKYGEDFRVNAIAPGFFIGEQNRDLLLNEDGSLTERGASVVDHTPAGRFGVPEELTGTAVWLCSPSSSFVNGIVVPVDGGFSAYAGV